MKAGSLLRKLIPLVGGEKWTVGPGLINDKYYELLISRDRQLAEAARDVKSYLLNGKSSRALVICDHMLVRYPGNPLFAGLRLQVENQQRQSRLKFIQRLCMEMENIPDLELRVGRLEQALGRFPGESQVAQLLRNTTARRDFVGSLVEQARQAESCDEYEHALEHWYTIRECHPALPNIAQEIERLESKRSEQERSNRRTAFLKDIHGLLAANQHERAEHQCTSAISEFPEDAEFLALQKRAEEKTQCATEIQGLIQDGLSFLDANDADAALRSFRAAGRLDQSNTQISALIGLALFARIKVVMITDLRAASLLLEEVAEVVPGHPELKRLSAEIKNQRRNGPKEQYAGRTYGDFGTLELDVQDDEPGSTTEAPLNRGEGFMTVLMSTAHSSWLKMRERLSGVPNAEILDTSVDNRWFASNKSVIGLVIVAAIVVFAGYALIRPGVSEQSLATVAPAAINIAVLPEGAEISIDGRTAGRSPLETKLAPGNYTVLVRLTGYEPQTIPLTVSSVARTLTLKLQPLPLDLRIVTDQPSGRVWMDDEPKGELSPEGITISGVAPGTHRLRVTTPAGEVRTDFDFGPEKLPVPLALPEQRTPAVLFVGSSNERLRVQCNCAPALFRINDAEQPLDARGLEMDLLEGAHPAELAVRGGKTLTIQGSRTPVATIGYYWGEASTNGASVENLLREANAMINNRRYDAALARVSQVESRSPGDDRALILRKRLERLMAIDP